MLCQTKEPDTKIWLLCASTYKEVKTRPIVVDVRTAGTSRQHRLGRGTGSLRGVGDGPLLTWVVVAQSCAYAKIKSS